MTLAQDRIAKGLCPTCGNEAAPYRLCWKCRSKNKLVYVLNRARKAGAFKSEKRGRLTYWSIGEEAAFDTIKWRPDLKKGDRRLDPKLRGIRIDVEATLVEVVRHAGRPVTLDEIMAAWGRLREKRSDPLPVDLARIIKAQEKRERRAKRLSPTNTASPDTPVASPLRTPG